MEPFWNHLGAMTDPQHPLHCSTALGEKLQLLLQYKGAITISPKGCMTVTCSCLWKHQCLHSSRSSPQYKICNRDPSFSRCRFDLSDNANSRLNLLKPNATTRGWLTAFMSDFIAQRGLGQPVAPLIVALARDGRTPRLAAKGPNQIIL